jgi:polysaccharide biosynthesis protein PslE
MEQSNFSIPENARTPSPTLRDVVAMAFRHRQLITLSFVGIFIGAVLAAILLPAQYEAHTMFLVKHERVDPVVTSEPNAMPQLSNDVVSEEDLNSEVELIKSSDLLQKVVETCGLQSSKRSFWDSLLPSMAGRTDLRIPKAVRTLGAALKVEPLKKSNLIEVTYSSTDPELSARVLTTLANDYLVKHVAVHRPPGAFDFFQHQTEQYRKELALAEASLADFSRDQSHGAVSPQVQMDLALQGANQFDATLQQARAGIAETKERIRVLEAQAAVTPPRLTTAERENSQLLEQLKSSLLTLELKRTELLGKFEPGYRLVQEVEAQIAQTRAAIAAEERAPVHEQTTDRNPTYQWLDGELAKARADLASFQAQAAATAESLRGYRNNALLLNQKEIVQQDLIRTIKADEGNYLLYFNKQEEARIADALDNKRIVNVAIAEAATVPALPVHSRWLFVLLGGLLASLVSAGSAFASDYFDPSFRTPSELETFLKVPVLASMPKSA